jgi:HD-like signal output (HDOD) protein
MIAAIRSGIGSLVDQWFRGARLRMAPRVINDRQGSRAQPRAADSFDAGGCPRTHADVAMLRFMAHALDASLNDLRNEATASELAGLEPATRVLGDLDLQAKYLPRRPSLLPRLMTAINSDSNSLRDMARIIGEDGTLLGGLLKLANSAYYGVRRHKPVESLEKAVALVGTDGLRSLVATALLHPVMTGTRGPFSSFAETTWEHSQFSANCAELHAAHIEGVDAFSARLLVLLRGLASNAVFRIAREQCLEDGVSAAAMARLLDDWVPTMALRIAENWQLPKDLRAVLCAPDEPGLARSLRFGRLAGALLVLVNCGHIRELSARAIVLADDHRRAQVDRLWSRLAIMHLAAAR